jgi:crotonobetainyl-CoA:carnitine CoA-transferase CaiB-like acyl-CoA transferase
MMLGDLGAEIIKIERPQTGDDTRSWGPPFIDSESAYFLSINRNKKSITLDLNTEEGRRIFYSLAEKSDVLLENFTPGVTERLKIDYETMKRSNPGLIYCSITSYGQTGTYRDRHGYDLVLQGMGGLMSITGEPDRPPVRTGVAVADLGGGMYAATAILAGLIARSKSGRGQWIDISLMDSVVSWMTYMAAYYFATGKDPTKLGSAHPTIVPYQCFKTSDGNYITIAAGNDKLFRSLCKSICKHQLADDPQFLTNSKRVENRDSLIPILEAAFLSKPQHEWLQILINEGIPAGPVYSLGELFSDRQVLERDMLVKMQHPTVGSISQIGIPMKFSETKPELKIPPPTLGQHTREVLRTLLGYDEAQINELERKGVI